MFLRKEKPLIHAFVRHCYFSPVSHNKKRPPGFTKEKCFLNLLQQSDARVQFHFLLDTAYANGEKHFLYKYNVPIIPYSAGKEAASFLALLDYVLSQKKMLDKKTILYFLEDDYLHQPKWIDILLEGFSLPLADYVTLYDHRDKYFLKMYAELAAKLFVTASCHWRSTPSTTNTYAMRAPIFWEDCPSQRRFSENCPVTRDHAKFLYLQQERKRLLLSPIPGFATHMEEAFASPCINWQRLLN